MSIVVHGLHLVVAEAAVAVAVVVTAEAAAIGQFFNVLDFFKIKRNRQIL